MDIERLSLALPELDHSTAIAQMGGDVELYEKALRTTAATMSDTISKMDSCLSASDMRGFHIVVHGLKGVLAIIGAASLAEEGQALSDAAKRSDLPAVGQAYPALRLRLIEFAQKIERLMLMQ